MAFTIAHAAAALPFYHGKKWINFEALLIGTMLPDLPYFLNSDRDVWQQSHQWLGVFNYCLPWGVLAFSLWHWILKAAAVALIQPWYAMQLKPKDRINAVWWDRLKAYSGFWSKVFLGLLVGASTHLLWDGTTHPDGFIAQQVGWLQYKLDIIGLVGVSVARFLQYVSSILGLLLIFAFTRAKLKSSFFNLAFVDYRSNVLSKPQSFLLLALLIVFSLFLALHAAVKWHGLISISYYSFFARVLVGFLQGAGIFFIAYALLYYIISHIKAMQR